MFFLGHLITFSDAPQSYQLGHQDPATSVVEGMINFHSFLVLVLLIIGTLVCWMLYIIIKNFNSEVNFSSNKFTHASLLEIVWTILPAVVLLIIAWPSFVLLYSLDDYIDPTVTLKIVGHQWYWSYEYSDFAVEKGSLNFDSYMVASNDLTLGAFRLLEVDNRVVLPVKTHIRLLITAADVLHSWAVPSFGIKVDACPGRLSQASLFIKREGTFYGQCSEICGVNHGFMPIVIRTVPVNIYTNWLITKLQNSI